VLENFGEFYVMLLELELVKHYVHMCDNAIGGDSGIRMWRNCFDYCIMYETLSYINSEFMICWLYNWFQSNENI